MSDQLSPSNPSSGSTTAFFPFPMAVALMAERDDLKHQLAVNTTLLQQARNEIENIWKQQVIDLMNHNKILETEQRVLQAKIQDLEHTNAQLRIEIQDLQQRIDQQERRIRTLEHEKSISESKLILFEFMDLLDRHFIREVYGPEYVGLTHLNDLLRENLRGSLDPNQKVRFQEVCAKLDLRSTVLRTTREIHETIRSFKDVRHQSVHHQHQMDRDLASLCEMSDRLCEHLGGEVDRWKLRGRALITLTFKALGDKPFEKDRILSASVAGEL
jgi:chromosome segregation ATPase